MRQNDMIQAGQRIAQCSMQAGFSYATAAFSAQANLFGQALSFWARTLEMTPEPEPKSWYRHPNSKPSPAQVGIFMFPFGAMTAPATPAATVMPFNPFAPFAFWMNAWPLQGNPAAWPMAFTMMGVGVPRNVAYPLAEANTAVMDAATTAGRVVEDSFASYRSNGGHASTQVRVHNASPGNVMSASLMAMTPLALGFMANWASLFGQVVRPI